MSENASIKNAVVTTEAPASWNTRYQTPEGFICQLTLRGENGKDLLEKANVALKWLLENGYLPCDFVPYRPKTIIRFLLSSDVRNQSTCNTDQW